MVIVYLQKKIQYDMKYFVCGMRMKSYYLTFVWGLEKVLESYKEKLWDWEGLEDWDGLGSLLE